jgi:hypothetical protein
MNIGQSFTYIFQDRNWVTKLVVGTLILLVSLPLTAILVGFLGIAIVLGYSLEVLRNVRQGNPQPLPEWRDRWSEWMVLGLKFGLVLLIWSLPVLLLSVSSSVATSIAQSSNDLFEAFGTMAMFTASILSFLWSLLLLFVTPAIAVRMAETEQVSSGLQFGDIYLFTRENLGDVVIAALVALAAGIVLTLLGSVAGVLLCIVGLAVTLPAATFITYLITAHLYGQIGMGTSARQQDPVTPEVVTPAEPQAKKPRKAKNTSVTIEP